MVRLLSAAFAASVTLSAAAYAADPQIIVTPDSNPQITRGKIVAAAEKLCAAAVAHDPFGDFGTQEECIANAVHDAYAVPASDTTPNKTFAQRSN